MHKHVGVTAQSSECVALSLRYMVNKIVGTWQTGLELHKKSQLQRNQGLPDSSWNDTLKYSVSSLR